MTVEEKYKEFEHNEACKICESINGNERPVNYHTSGGFWLPVALVFILISIVAVLLAYRSSKPLECVDTYNESGRFFCIAEIK